MLWHSHLKKVFESHKLLIVPEAVWDEHSVNGAFKPIPISNTCAAFKFAEQQSPHWLIGI